jgi:hypothetical protein
MEYLENCKASDVFARTLVFSSTIPHLGLVCDLTYEYRVYVLLCDGSTYYVGFEHRSKIRGRILAHFDDKGAFFTKQKTPKSVVLVWPAVGPAVEAYVFYAMLSALPANSVHRLGGWTQTLTNVAPLPRLLFEQDRRLLKGVCFNCGDGNHMASKCGRPLGGAVYRCNHCSKDLVITARGQSAPLQQVQPKALAKPLPKAEAAPSRQKRKAETPIAMPLAKQPKRSSGRAGRVLQICGSTYAPLSWYLGNQNPSPSLVARAKERCADHAIELEGGHCRALENFAGSPTDRLKSLTGNRERLGTDFVDSEAAKVRIRRVAGGVVSKRLSQVLFLVDDLEAEFEQS